MKALKPVIATGQQIGAGWSPALSVAKALAAAAEARRLGGLRRRRERTVSGAYDFAGLGSIESIRRILEIAVLDALGLENSIARARLLIAGSLAAAKLLETGELEERLTSLEAALRMNTTGSTRPTADGPGFPEAA